MARLLQLTLHCLSKIPKKLHCEATRQMHIQPATVTATEGCLNSMQLAGTVKQYR